MSHLGTMDENFEGEIDIVHHGIGILILRDAREDEEAELQIDGGGLIFVVLHHNGAVLKDSHEEIRGELRDVNDGSCSEVWNRLTSIEGITG